MKVIKIWFKNPKFCYKCLLLLLIGLICACNPSDIASTGTIQAADRSTATFTPSVSAPAASPPAPEGTLALQPTPKRQATPKAITSTPTQTPETNSIEIAGSHPQAVDLETGRIYTHGRVNGVEKTLVLAWIDESLLTTYDLVGELAVDGGHGWLYIDQGVEGLAVVNSRNEQLHMVISLPASHRPIPPQADPVSGQVIAFRDNVAFIIDPQSGSIVDTLAQKSIEFESNLSGGQRFEESEPEIEWAVYDPEARILYLATLVDTHSQSIGSFNVYMIVSYDLTSKMEIARKSSIIPSATAFNGYLYQLNTSVLVGGNVTWREVWREGKPWLSLHGLYNVGPIDFDPTRSRLYEVTFDPGSLRVYDADTMALTMLLPRPMAGTFEGYDPNNDALLFRVEGNLQSWPVGAVQAPTPEPLTHTAVPTTPVQSLTISPGWSADQTLFGFWASPAGADNDTYYCSINGQPGTPLYISRDGGQTWGQPVSGLRGSCEKFTSLAVSPSYVTDQTLLAGVLGLGIFKSTDGGRLWLPSGTGLTQMGVSKILLSPDFANDPTAFALTADTRDLFRSTDGGSTWQPLDIQSIEETEWEAAALSPEFATDRTLMGIIYNSTIQQDEVYISHDGGDRWEMVGQIPGGSYLQPLSLAPLFEKWQTVFAVRQENLYRSTDGGRHWQAVLTNVNQAQDLIYAPDIESNRPVFLWTNEKILGSGDGGQTWAEIELPDKIVPKALTISPNFTEDGLLFVGTADGQVIAVETKR